MKRTIAVLFITMLCACGDMLSPEDRVSDRSVGNKSADNQWVGRTIDELIVAIGEPSNVYALEGGGRAFEYLQPNKIKASTQPSLSAEDERVQRIRAKHKELASGQPQNCKILKILFKVSASDIIESWSTKSDECD